MYSADKFLLAEYALKHGMVNKWTTKSRNIRKDAKNAKKMFRQINQAKLQSYKNATVYMFGHEVPRNHRQAMELDAKNKKRTAHGNLDELSITEPWGVERILGMRC